LFCCETAVSKEQKPAKVSPSQKALIKEKMKQDRLVARQAKKDELKRKADEDRAKKKEVRIVLFLIFISLLMFLYIRSA